MSNNRSAPRPPVRALLALPWRTLLPILTLYAPVQANGQTFDCLITPSTILKVGSPVSTTLQSVSVERGDRVSKGQEIARLESSVEATSVALRKAQAENSADVLSHRAKLAAAEQEMARVSRQVEGFTVTGQKVAEMRTALHVAEQDLSIALLGQQTAQLELDRARAQLEQRVIRSPIDGVVTERLLGPSEYVHSDTHIVVLARINPLYVEVYPPVRYYGKINVDDIAAVEIDAPVGGSHVAKVKVVDQLFDAGSGTFGIRLELPNPDDRLPAGTRCTAHFAVEGAEPPSADVTDSLNNPQISRSARRDAK